MSDKVTAGHLGRKAFVYVRQSSMEQVRNNRESQRRQYELADKARSMGWSDVEVIDEDLGRSGASAFERTGFQRLVAEVGLGRCGAVFSLEASRLARNNADWYRLLDLCSLAKTLIVDGEAVYDPRQGNDRLLLGLKGAISEAELGLIYQRAQKGLLSKAKRGELFTNVPIGYVRTRDDRLEKDPNQRVRESVQGVFDKFRETGSARQTLLWYRQEKIRLPASRYSRWGWETIWKTPVYNTIVKFLKNPIYAGAYVWGRTSTETVVENGRARKRAGKPKPPGEWTVWIRDHHPGYLDWKTYERNQRILRDNLHMDGMRKGAVRSGRSLLAGLLHCGHCGRRLHVSYGGLGGRVPRYSCQGALLNHGGQRCISFGGLRVDRAIEAEILRVVQPAAIEAALTAAGQARGEKRLKLRLLERELDQLRYEAERAYRQYDAVDPLNRLVVETLERKWNAALERVQVAETRVREAADGVENDDDAPDRGTLLALAKSFPRIWADPKSDMKTKKRIARILIEEIVATVDESRHEVDLIIRWKGNKHTRLQVKKNRTGRHRFCTDKELVEIVRELATAVPDREIARILNRLGKKTGRGLGWNQSRVCTLRNYYKIPVFRRDDEADRQFCNMAQAAWELGISPMSVRRLIVGGVLPARQIVPVAPWRIRRKDLESDAVAKAVKSIKSGRKTPLPENPDQLNLLTSTT